MGRRKRRRVQREKRMPVYMKGAIIFLVVLLAAAGIGMIFTPVFHVNQVICQGNQRIPQEEIIAAAEVPMGKSILLQHLSGIRERVEQIPMIEEVKVGRVFPNKIRIRVRERVPAAYLYDGESHCAVVDLEGQILEILDSKIVAQMKEFYTPAPAEKTPEKQEDSESEDPQEEDEAETEGESSAEESAKPKEVKEPKRSYTIPFVTGIQLDKPQVGKMAESKEREKFAKVQETFRALEKAGLLVRATYMDVSDLSDVMLVIENRLEIQMGEIRNMEYRCKFLATVISEKISATEQAVMDYRGNDIYVRQPDDGKERMVPKPKEEPETEEETAEETEEKSQGE